MVSEGSNQNYVIFRDSTTANRSIENNVITMTLLLKNTPFKILVIISHG